MEYAGILTEGGAGEGCLFRAINKSGQIWGHGMTPKVLWEIVKKAAEAAGIYKLAPHDLRRYTECKTMPNEVTGCTSATLFDVA
jgi:hypothetical protein